MQNKGAIRLFAILMALACLFYLSFSLVTRGIEKDARQQAVDYASGKFIQDSAKKFANGDAEKENYFIDSVITYRENRYLDSVRKLPVYDIFITSFTYEDCKEKEINLGLDLRGGMNVTLEVSVADIIRAMSNRPDDEKLKEALKQAHEKEKTDNRDYATLFGEALKKIDPEHPLAYYFRSIDQKDITMKSTDEEVLAYIRKTVDQSINTAEQTLRARIDRFGVTQPTIQKLAGSGRILIELPGISDKQRVRKLLQGTANLEFWETFENKDLVGALGQVNGVLKNILSPTSKDTAAKDTANVTANADSLKNKDVKKSDSTLLAKNDSAKNDSAINDLLAKDTGKVMSREDSLKQFQEENPFLYNVFFPNIDQQNQPADGPIIGSALPKDTGKVMAYLNLPEVRKLFPANVRFMWGNKPPKWNTNILQLYAIKVTDPKGKAALSGDIITEATKSFNQQQGGNAIVEMTMKDEAAKKWQILTKENAPKGDKPGGCIAIVLDNLVYSAPTVQGEISGGRSQITGDFTIREAEDLANILSAGRLPAPAKIVEEQIVGPSLGKESIEAGLLSFVIAFFVVLLFMAFYYSKAGWVANIALLCNIFFIVGVLSSLGAVLTLPGIAGIVLTIGLSVDANILIYERVREELRAGKGIRLAISEGFRHAMSSILDSNITLLLLGIILFAYGTGPVQGFATTLIIGVLSSLFCAIFITRLVFERMLKKERNITFGNKLTENAFTGTRINFVARRKLYYLISAVIIALGTVFYFKNGGFKLGVDFKGGYSFVVKFEDPQPTEPVIKTLDETFGIRPEVKTYGTDNSLKITTTYLIDDRSEDANERVEAKLEEGLKKLGNNFTVESQSKVGETISRDIRNSSIAVVLFSCVVMFFYILIRFKKWQYGMGAVIALFHDVLIVLSFYTIFDGLLPFSLEIDQHFIAAILTVMGYTMTESVIVFDRIREFLAEKGKRDMEGEEKRTLINYALNSTLSRTINTSLTIFFVLIVIFIFGGEVIRGFIFALLIGRVIGTYSSLCISTPIVIDFDRKQKAEVKA
ncbi:MAG: protein translocase subunit SecDF [Bacteroidota bacterium]